MVNALLEFQAVIDKKQQYAEQQHDTEQFFKELSSSKTKFDKIAEYYGRGLFSSIGDFIVQQNEK